MTNFHDMIFSVWGSESEKKTICSFFYVIMWISMLYICIPPFIHFLLFYAELFYPFHFSALPQIEKYPRFMMKDEVTLTNISRVQLWEKSALKTMTILTNHCLAKSIEFIFIFRLCGLNHERSWYRPWNSWSMESWKQQYINWFFYRS